MNPAKTNWPLVTSVLNSAIVWTTTTNLESLPEWARALIALGVAIASGLVTEYGVPGVKATPGVWSARSVEQLTQRRIDIAEEVRKLHQPQ